MDELAQAQATLGRSIDRARAGEDPQLAGIVREKGEQMVGLLFGLLRMSRSYAPENPALNQPIGELTSTIARLVGLLGALQLVAVEEQVYLNEIRVRTPQQGKDGKGLAAELAPHMVGGLTFTSAPSEQQMRSLLQCLNARPPAERQRAALRQALIARGVDNIEPAVIHRLKTAGEAERAADKVEAKTVVTRGVELVEDTWEGVAEGRRMNILPLRRVVTDLLELHPGHDQLWWNPPGASAHGLHSFRVCQYSLILAEGASLSVGLRQDLGVAALLHDIGVARGGGGEPHIRAGSLTLLQQPGFHEGKVRRVLAAFDHHRQIVETVGGRSTLFGRILHIADDYDNLVRSGTSPSQAIGSISGGAGIRYDPVLFQAFINRMGKYPPGTLLKLEDGRIVRTLSVVRSTETFAQPRAMVVRGADGKPPTAAIPVDLAQGVTIASVVLPA
ncbi:MAG: HD domain-containing protein [Deltaproteobacteria bacterium]|nr:MAG: HD domain-containing protein [Deltaproteobacteria bacterium]